MAKNPKATQPKELKKNDFLALVLAEPESRTDIKARAESEGYEFLETWFDYLVDHFEAQGRITVNGDGLISRKVKSGAGPRDVYRVAFDDEGEVHCEKRAHTGNLTDEDKEEGWRNTEGAARKTARSEVFADYKALVEAINGAEVTEAEEA